jgi:hypothetical protein
MPVDGSSSSSGECQAVSPPSSPPQLRIVEDDEKEETLLDR